MLSLATSRSDLRVHVGREIIPNKRFGRQDLSAQGSVTVTGLTFCLLA